MATGISKVDIFNMALTQLGAMPVSSPTENSKNARACLQVYDFIRMAELRKAPYWNFAVNMAQLAVSPTTPLFDRAYSYPLPADFICLADSFPESNYNDKDWLIQQGQIYTNGSYWYPQVNAGPTNVSTFTFVTASCNANEGAIYANSGETFTVVATTSTSTTLVATGTSNPAPSGTLIYIGGNAGDATISYASFSVNATTSTANPGPLNIRYVRDVTDTTQFDPLFALALAMKIAYTISDSITQSNSKKKEAMDAYTAAIMDARKANSFDDVSEQFPTDTYITARL